MFASTTYDLYMLNETLKLLLRRSLADVELRIPDGPPNVTIFSSAGSTRGLDVTGLNKLVVASVTSIVEVRNVRFAYSPNSPWHE